MSWIPPTPPVTPVVIRTAHSAARLLGSSLLVREAADALLRLRGAQPQSIPGKRPTFTRTKTKMKVKRQAKTKVSAAIKREIRKVSMRNTEIKNCSTGSSASLTHATQQAYNQTAIIINGTNSLQRVGDEIFLQYLRLNFLISAPTTAGAYSYRLMAVYSSEEYANTSFSTASLAFSEMFLINATAGTNVSAVPNLKAITILYDTVVDVNSNITGVSEVANVHTVINLKNHRFPYQAGGSAQGKFKNLYIVVIPYVVGGVVGTTGCGTVNCNASLDFRDP